MFALRIALLSGRYVATAYNDRDRAEWPPHPARLFSAFVAAYGEHAPESVTGEDERAALEWLESQDAPVIVADPEEWVARRSVATVFVPVNDAGVIAQPERERQKLHEAIELLDGTDANVRVTAERNVTKAAEALAARTAKVIAAGTVSTRSELKAARILLPDGRERRGRTFPSVTPRIADVEMRWASADLPPEHVAAMDRLVRRIARLGHSSSLVSVSVANQLEAPHPERVWQPHTDGSISLRWVLPGQTQLLVEAHQRHNQVEPRVMPCSFVAYSLNAERTTTPARHSVFDTNWIILSRTDGPRLSITAAVGLARQMVRALQSSFGNRGEPVPELVSGHQADGSRSEQPHLAVVPLPNVGSTHADGALLGIALVLPRTVPEAERREFLRAVAHLENDDRELSLLLGPAGTWSLERVGPEPARTMGLRADTWTRTSVEWITATPIALDHNPGDLHHLDPVRRAAAFDAAEASVSNAVEHIGLPRPRNVEVSRSTMLAGSAKPRAFPRFPVATDRPQRVLVHARLRFDEPVTGPILLGAGRYLGLGLCRPLRSGDA